MQIFRISTAQVKVHQIAHFIFKVKCQVFFKVWIFFQCHKRYLFCTFLAETLYAIGKSSTSKLRFSDLSLPAWKFTKFFMSYLEPRVSISWNFVSLFSATRHNSFVLFHLNLCVLWTKGYDQSAKCQTFDCSSEK